MSFALIGAFGQAGGLVPEPPRLALKRSLNCRITAVATAANLGEIVAALGPDAVRFY
jgi:hypothetical protein